MDPEETQPRRVTRPRRSFLSWLRRDPEPSIAAVMAQWLEYELIFNDILTRLGAQLARQAKIEKRRLQREQVDIRPAPAPAQSAKAALRSQYALSRFGGRVERILAEKQANGGHQNVPYDEAREGDGDDVFRAAGDRPRADGDSHS